MLLTRGLCYPHLLLALAVCLFDCHHAYSEDSASPAETTSDVNKGHGFVGFRTGVYHNDDQDDGNPFLDEQLTVIEPVIIYDYNVTDDLAWWGKLSYDYVSSASIKRLNKFPRQSGASGDYYIGLDTGARYKLSDDTQVGGFVGASTEFDYDSFGGGLDISHDSKDRNTTVKLGINGFIDTIDIIRFNGDDSEGKDERGSVSTALTWYQVLTPKTHGNFGATVTYQSGFLETAFNSVVIENQNFPQNLNFDNRARGIEVSEQLPSDRTRAALFANLKHYVMDKTALGVKTRYYSDTWDISSFSIESQIARWVLESTVNLRLRHRYYFQSESKYFEDHYNFDQFLSGIRYRTQDADLGSFHSNMVGMKFDIIISESLKLDIAGDYIMRSDGINQIVGSIGITRNF